MTDPSRGTGVASDPRAGTGTGTGATPTAGTGGGSGAATVATRTLSLLPTVVGLFGIGGVVLIGVLAGVTDGSQGWAAVAVAALAVAITVATGGSYGLYAGLTALAVGGLVADGGPTATEVTVLPIGLLIVHEVIRFSLDARQPSRFGPGVIVRYGLRLLAVAVVVLALSAMVHLLIDRAPTGALLVPVGLAAAAVPLFVWRAVGRFEHRPTMDHHMVRAALGVALTIAVVSLAAIGAQARTTVQDTPAVAGPPTTTTTVPTVAEQIGEGRPIPGWLVIVAILLLVLAIYLILRRPEAIFQLEEVDRRVEDNSFDLAVARLANAEDEVVGVDEDALARLLRNLKLDISAERDPGRAIRFGYAKTEQQLTERGLSRTAVETEREFLARALPDLGSAGPSMVALTELFELARFGHQPVTEQMRHQALAAIDGLLDHLGGETR